MNLLGINFYKGTYCECLETLKNRKVSTLVVTPNPEMLYEASRDTELLKMLKDADYALPDGAGIFVGYQIGESTFPKWLKYCLPPYWCLRAIIHSKSFAKKYGERITGSRLTRDLIAYAAHEKIPVIIMDPIVHGNSPRDEAKRESQKNMKKNLEEKFPGIECKVIIGDSLSELIHLSTYPPIHPIIFATHGNGKQEKLLAELVQKYPQCGLCMGVGGSIDLITGFRSPAPKFFQRFGGEWLYRLIKNPSRHWKRMKKVITFLFSLI